MPAEYTHPEFVYRLATAEEWAAAIKTGIVPTRDIDERDGYFHLSTREQVLETARLHFGGAEDLLVLKTPFDEIAGDVKFELAAKRGEKFPHLFGSLYTSQVMQALRLISNGDGFEFGAPYAGGKSA